MSASPPSSPSASGGVSASGPTSGATSAPTSGARQVLDTADCARAVRRIAHEILERNQGAEGIVIVGMQKGGTWIAEAIVAALAAIEGREVLHGALDVTFHRDDIGLRPVTPGAVSEIPVDLTGRTVVLVDDVLFTGRTVRAALDALHDYGRPAAVQLAVMVDRGHRELPIRPDYVGKNLPTSRDEDVTVSPDGVFIGKLVA